MVRGEADDVATLRAVVVERAEGLPEVVVDEVVLGGDAVELGDGGGCALGARVGGEALPGAGEVALGDAVDEARPDAPLAAPADVEVTLPDAPAGGYPAWVSYLALFALVSLIPVAVVLGASLGPWIIPGFAVALLQHLTART